jgi:hypothetical protein
MFHGIDVKLNSFERLCNNNFAKIEKIKIPKESPTRQN